MPQQPAADKKHRKMVGLNVVETSGVDHPAHLHEGWVVCKSAPAARVEDAFGSLNTTKEAPVPTIIKNAEGVEVTQEQYDAVVAELAAKAEAEAGAEPEGAAPAAAEPAAPAAAPAADEDADFAKALASAPEAVQVFLAKAAADAAAAREEVQKERDARLDGEAIAKSRETFKNLAFDHATFAPALRRVEAIAPAVAKSITEVLKAAEGQLESGEVITKELGTTASPATGTSKLDIAAADLVKSGVVPTHAQGIAKALEIDPSLYSEFTANKEGK
ncbi:hypothetical protein SEA_WHEELBITE_23 [Arthrobacter phage Wheelbite]|uniref:Uncharacterized protein n=1 Tax=Arthrobacter phage Wheelbite TaxID=2015873 RepID=A0A222ZHC1_9CAUD|nr:hypothetical protein KMD23_gp23 [Arthrobacter phage Wheelbite]ASR84116.1 hypothetical protein SEA_WHEELBITE_23 [Arthrobacter phage Wheelbite]